MNLLPSTVPETSPIKTAQPHAFVPNAKRRKPVVTYGKNNRPIPLAATQFLQSSFAFFPDKPSEDSLADGIGPSFQAHRQQDPESDSSLLSGAEDFDYAPSDHGRAATKAANQNPPGKLKSISKPHRANKGRTQSRITKVRHQKSNLQNKTDDPDSTLEHKTARRPKKRPRAAPRHLPVNELVLVASALHDKSSDGSEDSEPNRLHEDPIEAFTSSPRRCGGSRTRSESVERQPESSFFTLKKRLRKPCIAPEDFKQIPRRKPAAVGTHLAREIGDGFEGFETALKCRGQSKRKRCKGHVGPITYALAALELGTGPLPPAEFVDSSSALELREDENVDEGLIVPGVDDPDASESALDHHPSQPAYTSRRQVSFTDKIREDLISAQLSSVSAPPRRPSDSDSDDEDIEDGGEDTMSLDGDQRVDSDQGEDDDDVENSPCPSTRSGTQSVLSRRSTGASESYPSSPQLPFTVPESEVMYYEFHKPGTPGQLPPLGSGRRKLLDVNGDIIQVEDSSDHHPAPSRYASLQSENMLDDGLPLAAPPLTTSRHPRSIFKSDLYTMQEKTTRPEDTESNIRRNSLAQAASSRYSISEQRDPADRSSNKKSAAYRVFSNYNTSSNQRASIPWDPLRTHQTTRARISFIRSRGARMRPTRRVGALDTRGIWRVDKAG